MTIRIAVIIPYYQVEPGILARALDGIISQELPDDVALRVLVIDDASPHRAVDELAQHPHTAALDLVVERQTNGGPGDARNRGLDRARDAGDVDFVAFLDSDDVWSSCHLADALATLDRGYDFFCCDTARPGSFDRLSDNVAILKDEGAQLADCSELLNARGPVRGFAPHVLDDQFVTDYLSHTSTVVLRADTVRDIRFDSDLRSASEDRMFFISVALSGARVAISWANNVTCGAGVNLFFSAYDWNATATIERIGCQLLFAEKLMLQPHLNDTRLAFAEDRAHRTRRAYAFLFIRMILKLRRPPVRTFRRLVRFDPMLPVRMPALFLGVLFDRSEDARQF